MMDDQFFILKKKITLAEMINDASIDQILALNTNWEIIAWNKACEAATSFTKEKVLGKSILEIFPLLKTNEEVMKALEMTMAGFKTFVPSERATYRPGYFEHHFVPLKNENDEVFGVLNIIHNVAHRIKAENELKVLNRQLATLNSQLNAFTDVAINNYSETLRNLYTNLEFLTTHDAKNLSNSGRANIRRSQAAIQKMKLLTADVIAFNKLHELEKKAINIDLNQLFVTIVEDFKTKYKGVSVEIQCDQMASITGYPFLVSLLFHHLVDNAIKFRGNDISATVKVECKKIKGSLVQNDSAEKNIDYYLITVSDEGIGFDNSDKEKIFDLFTRLHESKYRGSGVGLAICKKIMELHGGFISADGEINKGARFYCYFPEKETNGVS